MAKDDRRISTTDYKFGILRIVQLLEAMVSLRGALATKQSFKRLLRKKRPQ